MARCLSDYYKAEEPLDEGALYNNTEVIVEDSDIDESPFTKVERNRRRNAIGRRYLLGYTPLIQTASLRGPFDSKSGWVSLWRRIQNPRKSRQSHTQTRYEFEAVNTWEALGAKSERFRIDKPPKAYLKEGVHDDNVNYDADNEDETFEDTQDKAWHPLEYEEDVDVDRAQHTFTSHYKARSLNSKTGSSYTAEEGPIKQIRHHNTTASDTLGQVLLLNGGEREVDTGWLKGENVLKRSWYDTFACSSPTPATGLLREDNKRQRSRLSPQTSDSRTPEGLGRYQGPQRSNNSQLRTELEARDDIRTKLAVFNNHGEFSSEVTEGSTHSRFAKGEQIVNTSSHPEVAMPTASSLSSSDLAFARNPQDKPKRKRKQDRSLKGISESITTPSEFEIQKGLPQSKHEQLWTNVKSALAVDRRGRDLVCGELGYKATGECDFNNKCQASWVRIEDARLSTITQAPGRPQLEVIQLSPSDIDASENRSLSILRPLPHKVARSTTQTKDQVSGPVYGTFTLPEAIVDKIDILPHFNNIKACGGIPLPASEESFHYRRTNWKPQGQKSNPHSHKGDVERVVENKELSTPERESTAFQPIDLFVDGSMTSASSGDAENLGDMQNATNWGLQRDGNRQSWRASPETKLDLLDELVRVSSEPLCEDFKDNYQQRIISSNVDPKTAQNTNPFLYEDTATNGQRIMVTQASPRLRVESDGTQSASRGLSQPSTSQGSRECLEFFAPPAFPTQRQLSGSNASQSLLPTQAESASKTLVRQGLDYNGRTSSQSKSPNVNKTSTQLPRDKRQPSLLVTQPAGLEITSELSELSGLSRLDGSSTDRIPTTIHAQVLEGLAKSTQSPWIAGDVEPLRAVFSADIRPESSSPKAHNGVTTRHQNAQRTEEKDCGMWSVELEETVVTDDANRNEEDNSRQLDFTVNYSQQPLCEIIQLGARFPSTQTLVEATTSNPWNSALKKPRPHKPEKRVSFGPLPEGVEDSAGFPSRLPERMGSPPPPAGTLRLTHLDDPFHHKLKAIRNLEVTEKSLTKFMNTPWDCIPPDSPHPTSPANAAMAEAFIAADQHCLYERVDNKEKLEPANHIALIKDNRKELMQPQIWVASRNQELKSSSPLDGSFSIASSGKVTAVSFEALGIDAEDNLQAVLEDMGSFLEGWDVESELKKAKGHTFEGGSNIKGQRKRGYLSGISNR